MGKTTKISYLNAVDRALDESYDMLLFLRLVHCIPPVQIQLYKNWQCMDKTLKLHGTLPNHIFADEPFYKEIPDDIEVLNRIVTFPLEHKEFYEKHKIVWVVVVQKLHVLRLREYYKEIRNYQRLHDKRRLLLKKFKGRRSV